MSNFDWFEESIKVLPTSHFVEVRDKKIHYLQWGEFVYALTLQLFDYILPINYFREKRWRILQIRLES